MKITQDRTFWIAAALVSLMALTRYNHFGSVAALPDASYAVFFLGGLFLGRMRNALGLLVLLLAEAALVDYYAINFAGISGWCVTSAYSFLIFSYSALWFAGRWYAPRHDLSSKGLFGLFAAAAVAGSMAFIISNVSFYLLSGYFGSMGVAEFAVRVAPYFASYVEVALFYIGAAAVVQMLYGLFSGRVLSSSDPV